MGGPGDLDLGEVVEGEGEGGGVDVGCGAGLGEVERRMWAASDFRFPPLPTNAHKAPNFRKIAANCFLQKRNCFFTLSSPKDENGPDKKKERKREAGDGREIY